MSVYGKQCNITLIYRSLLSVYGKQCNIALIYRLLSQSSEQFDKFLSNFEFLLDYIGNRNPFVSIIIGDFNVRSSN